MTQPFFSILLPTKNRSHLVGFSIRSVLQQDFNNFELIICDNDDDSDATRLVVENYPDSRIKYIRTGGLDMVANWNIALDAATGRHVTILEDKMIFYPRALAGIKKDIEQSPSGVVVWKCDVIEDDSDSPVLIQQANVETEQLINSEQVLEKVVTNVMGNWNILPRGLCCTVPKVTIDSIVKDSGKSFYETVSPDFASAIKLLATIDEYCLSSGVYTMITSNKVSNGKQISQRKFKDHSYFMGNKKINFSHEDCYVKSDWIVVNSVIGDYLKQQQQLGGKLNKFSVSNECYFGMLLRELVVSSKNMRQIAWNMEEIKQLYMGGDGFIKNFFYTVQFSYSMLGSKIEKLFGKTRGLTGVIRLTLPDSMERYVDDYLSGRLTPANRSAYG